MRSLVLLMLAACDTEITSDLEMTPVKTATLRVGANTNIGDVIDLTTDIQAAFGVYDVALRRSPDLLTAQLGFPPQTFALAVGPVTSPLDIDVTAPGLTAGGASEAVTGLGFAMRTFRGAPAALRIGEITRGTVTDGSSPPVDNAITAVTIEYSRAVSHDLEAHLTLEVEPGVCPSGQLKVSSSSIAVAIPQFASVTVSTSPMPDEVLAIPRGFEVTLSAADAVTWGGACSGSSTCTLTMSADRVVTAHLVVPHRCFSGG